MKPKRQPYVVDEQSYIDYFKVAHKGRFPRSMAARRARARLYLLPIMRAWRRCMDAEIMAGGGTGLNGLLERVNARFINEPASWITVNPELGVHLSH